MAIAGKASRMKFKLFGVNYYISVLFCVLLTFMLIVDVTGFMAISLFAVLTHELGHIIIMHRLKCCPRQVSLTSYGVGITGPCLANKRDEIKIAMAGPVANFLMTIVFLVLHRYTGDEMYIVVAVIQTIVGGVNLLPVRGLDGGTVVYNALSLFTSESKSNLIMTIISLFVAAGMTALGVTLLFKGQANPSLLLLGVYLVFLNIFKMNNDDCF